jgi:hypothetical protein
MNKMQLIVIGGKAIENVHLPSTKFPPEYSLCVSEIVRLFNRSVNYITNFENTFIQFRQRLHGGRTHIE